MKAVAISTRQLQATIIDRQKLERGLDDLRREVLALDRLWKPYSVKPDIAKFRQAREAWLSAGAKPAVETIGRLWDLCDNPAWFDEKAQAPRPSEVGKALAALLGSFPTSNIPNVQVYTSALLDDVIGLELSFWHGLEAGCRRIRQTRTFMPSIAEVLTVLREEDKTWEARHTALIGARFYLDDEAVNLAVGHQLLPERAAAVWQPVSEASAVGTPEGRL